ncbi:MAG: metal-sensitive transcriptional regulator [Atribacterota bacterium]|nr:metal-sensitive transcriptional regulator [Atribacterota bacterium]
MITEREMEKLQPRLKKIEGQVKGLGRMVENGEYCVDILQQISAVSGALKAVGLIILENHVNTCVRQAMVSRDDQEVKNKVEELIEIYKKFTG